MVGHTALGKINSASTQKKTTFNYWLHHLHNFVDQQSTKLTYRSAFNWFRNSDYMILSAFLGLIFATQNHFMDFLWKLSYHCTFILKPSHGHVWNELLYKVKILFRRRALLLFYGQILRFVTSLKILSRF